MVSKSPPRRRRSQMRLGTQTINYKVTTAPPRLTLTPVLKFWQLRGASLLGVLTLTMLGWGVYTLFTTPRFFIYGADIRGNMAVSTTEIYTMSGIDSQSIFWLNPTDVVARLQRLPNIKSVSVSVALPAQVVIEVVGRRPELLWQTGETVWWIDQEGTIVPPKGDVTGMLRIIDDDQLPLEAGHQIDPTLVEGAQTLRILAPDLSVLRYSRNQGLLVSTPEGWPVYLGDGSQVKAKLVVLTTVLADLKAQAITPTFIDLRDPQRPFYRQQAVIQIGPPGQRKTR